MTAGPVSRSAAVVRDTRESIVSVFSNRNLARMQVALLISLVGDLAFATAVTVWAFGEGGATAVAVLIAARLAAAAATAPVAAAITDRVSRRSTLLVTLGGRATLIAAAAGCLLGNVESPWPVYVLAAAAGVLVAPFRTAQRAWMPALAAHPRELAASNATSGTLESLAVFLGPALGGLLLVVTSVPAVFGVTVAALVVAAVAVLAIRPEHRGSTALVVPHDEPAGLLRELSAGFQTVFGDPDLRIVTGQVCAQTFIGGAAKVFLVVIAVQILDTGAEGVGFLEAALGVGALVGGVVAIARSSRQRLGWDMTVGVLLWSVPLLLIAAFPHLVVVVAVLVVVGAANPVVDINLDTIVQRMTPEHRMARVFGALDTCYITTQALGSLAMAPLLHLLGLQWALVVIALPVAVAAALSLGRMRSMDARLQAPEALGLLRGIPWFASLTPPTQESLARSLTRTEVAGGTAVVTQGENGDELHVIESGLVEVTQDGRPLRTQDAGTFFGEIALLYDTPRSATVTALTDTVLLSLRREDFLAAVTGVSRSLAEDTAATRLAFRG